MKRYFLCAVLIGLTLSTVASATMVRQQWNTGIGGSLQAIETFLVDLVNPTPTPDVEVIIDNSFFLGTGSDNYVAKFYGWVEVPATGTYQFHYFCDDYGMLYVSQNEEMANAVQVAYVEGWTTSREWNKYASQHSEPMNLKQGQVMAVMAFYQESTGDDWMGIGWTGPGLSSDITNPTDLTDYITHIMPTPAKARNPRPEDGAADVSRDVVLSWSPGEFAATHNVYLGTNFGDVNSATTGSPLLVSQGQDANTCDPPGLLAYGQTYYWRVDEVNAPPSSTVFKGSVWSFTVEPFYYAVENVVATASIPTAEGSGGPEVTVDESGLTNGAHGVADPTMWSGEAVEGEIPWLQYDFDRVYKLYGIHVWNYNGLYEFILGFGLKDITIEYAVEPNEWMTLGDYSLARGTNKVTYAGQLLNLDGVPARSIRININSTQSGGLQPGLAEIRFLHKPVFAREPKPADGATQVNRAASLSWRPGREAATHQVHLGTDANEVADGAALAGSTSTAVYDPGPLTLGTTYYWKVDEVNDLETPAVWDSAVWSFTTQEYVAIDNFESYSDDEGNRIYQTWLDGYDIAANGSIVGHDKPPYAEKTIRNSGTQSMPFYYTNTGSVAYSEAELVFASPQDWTANGADTFSLHHRGIAAGFAKIAEDNIVMNGTGADIWGTTDQFRFVYKQLTGDGSIIARVEYLDYTDEWAKGGVMIRETLESDSVLVDGVFSARRRVCMQWRTARAADMGNPDTSSNSVNDTIEFPQWIKLTRTGNVFKVQHSEDGVTWLDIVPDAASDPTQITQVMPQTVYIGLAVCSHNANAVAGAQFTGIKTTGNVTGQWQSASIGVDQSAGNGIDTFYMTIEDSTGKKATFTNPNPAAVGIGSWRQWMVPLNDITAAGVKANSVKKLYLGIGDKTQPSKNVSGVLYIDDIAFGRPIE